MKALLVLIKLFELLRGSVKEVYFGFSVLVFLKVHAIVRICFLNSLMAFLLAETRVLFELSLDVGINPYCLIL